MNHASMKVGTRRVRAASASRRRPGWRRSRGHGNKPPRQNPCEHVRDHEQGALHRYRDAQGRSEDRLQDRRHAAGTIRPVGINITRDGKTGFVALEPSNHVAVVDEMTHQVTKYLLVGQGVSHMAFTPDEKYLLTMNGVSNDVSIIDVSASKVINTMIWIRCGRARTRFWLSRSYPRSPSDGPRR
jgi:YVTN family beta-propeller protein